MLTGCWYLVDCVVFPYSCCKIESYLSLSTGCCYLVDCVVFHSYCKIKSYLAVTCQGVTVTW